MTKIHKKKAKAKLQKEQQPVVAATSSAATPAATTPAVEPTPQCPTHLLKKLSNAEESTDDRAWAAAAIANLCSVPETRTLLLHENVVGCLVDAFHTAVLAREYPVLLQVAAAIRNLVVESGEQDDQVLAEMRDEIFQVKDKVIEDIHALVKQVLYIVWMLCESLDSATQAFSTNEIFMTFIVRIYSPDFVTSTFGDAIGIVESASRLFLTLTEENPQVTPILKRRLKDLSENLRLVARNEEITIGLRLLVCGILNNLDVYHFSRSTILCEIPEEIFPVFSYALQYDLSTAIAKVASGEDADGLPLILKDAGNLVLALELASNALSFNPPVDKIEEPLTESEIDDKEIDGDEDGDDAYEEMMMDTVMDEEEDEEVEESTSTSLQILDRLESLLLAVCKTVISSPPNMASSAFTSILSTILSRSLTCLSDIYLANPERGSIPANTQLFSWMSELFVSGAGLTLSSSALDVMYALSKSSFIVCEYSDALVESLIASMGGEETSSVKIVAIFARIATNPCSIPRNTRIGDLLMTVLDQGAAAPAAVVFEALDALFDVYADADFEYDGPVFRARGYLGRLKGLVASVRAIVRSVDRRVCKEVRGKGDECLINLRAFIAYKEGELQ